MDDKSLLAGKVVQEIKKEILCGLLSPGSKIPAERDLAVKYNVSRGTVRTAISRLVQLGFMQTVPKSGTFVKDYLKDASMDLLVDIMTSSDTVDTRFLSALLDLRRIVEVHYTKTAVLQMNEADLWALKRLADDMGTPELTIEDLVEQVYQFHYTIIRLSGNPVLRFLANSFEPVHRYYLKLFFRIPGNAESVTPYYKKLNRAVQMGDERYAAFVMEELLEHTENSIKATLDETQTDGGASLLRTGDKKGPFK